MPKGLEQPDLYAGGPMRGTIEMGDAEEKYGDVIEILRDAGIENVTEAMAASLMNNVEEVGSETIGQLQYILNQWKEEEDLTLKKNIAKSFASLAGKYLDTNPDDPEKVKSAEERE